MDWNSCATACQRPDHAGAAFMPKRHQTEEATRSQPFDARFRGLGKLRCKSTLEIAGTRKSLHRIHSYLIDEQRGSERIARSEVGIVSQQCDLEKIHVGAGIVGQIGEPENKG